MTNEKTIDACRDAFNGPALSSAVAMEVMGWHDELIPHMWSMTSGDELKGLFPKSDWVPHCDTRDARKVIAEIQRRGLMKPLQMALYDIHLANKSGQLWWDYIITVPPSDICRAALRVVREAKQ